VNWDLRSLSRSVGAEASWRRIIDCVSGVRCGAPSGIGLSTTVALPTSLARLPGRYLTSLCRSARQAVEQTERSRETASPRRYRLWAARRMPNPISTRPVGLSMRRWILERLSQPTPRSTVHTKMPNQSPVSNANQVPNRSEDSRTSRLSGPGARISNVAARARNPTRLPSSDDLTLAPGGIPSRCKVLECPRLSAPCVAASRGS
jgi:hypothetical protein